MARQFPGQVRFVSENFGESELAERFGVKRYPAVFIDGVLVAKPKDFGFFGESGSQGDGRYTPWLNEANRALFRDDMERLVGKAVRGELSSADGVEVRDDATLTTLPEFALEDLEGNEVSTRPLLDSIVIVDFWATWCPPCIASFPSLSELQRAHPDELVILGVAIESTEADVRKLATKHELPFPVVLGSAELAIQFGDVVAVPTAFVFDRGGRLVKTFYGAPPELKDELEALVNELASATER